MNHHETSPDAQRFFGIPDGEEETVADPALPDAAVADIPIADEEIAPIEIEAAQSLGLVVPNRISYGVNLRRGGTNGSDVVWVWRGLIGGTCNRDANDSFLWGSSINRFERAGWCRRPQTDAYDIRWKIYWRA